LVSHSFNISFDKLMKVLAFLSDLLPTHLENMPWFLVEKGGFGPRRLFFTGKKELDFNYLFVE